jgi:hypothetical protein
MLPEDSNNFTEQSLMSFLPVRGQARNTRSEISLSERITEGPRSELR